MANTPKEQRKPAYQYTVLCYCAKTGERTFGSFHKSRAKAAAKAVALATKYPHSRFSVATVRAEK